MIDDDAIARAMSLCDGRLDSILIERGKMGFGTCKTYGDGDDLVFVTGSGVLVEPEVKYPVWGPLCVFPYLLKSRTRFYDGRPSLGSDWVRNAHHAMMECSGTAIIVFNEQPWNIYWETAVTAYLVGKGFGGLHFVVQRAWENGGHYSDKKKPNIQCTSVGQYTEDERVTQVNLIARELIESYCAETNRRIYTHFHSEADMDIGISAEIDLPMRYKRKALSTRILSGLKCSESCVDVVFEKEYSTDIAIIITLIFNLASSTERTTARSRDLAIARGIVSNYVKSERPELEPVITLLDCISK